MEMSGQFPVQNLCKVLDVNHSGFYKWKKRMEHPSDRLKAFVSNVRMTFNVSFNNNTLHVISKNIFGDT